METTCIMSSEAEKRKISGHDLESGRKKEQQRASKKGFERPGLQESDTESGKKPAFLLDVESKKSMSTQRKCSVDEKIQKEKEGTVPKDIVALNVEGSPTTGDEDDSHTGQTRAIPLTFEGTCDEDDGHNSPEAIHVGGQTTPPILEPAVTGTTSVVPPHTSSEDVEQQDEEQEEEQEEEVAIDAYLAGRRRGRQRSLQLIEGRVVERVPNENNKRYVVGVFFVWLFVAMAVVLSLIFVFKQEEENESVGDLSQSLTTTGNPSSSPTMVSTTVVQTAIPSISPSESHAPTSERLAMILDEVRRQFQTSTLEEDLLSRFSPQYQAALWMAEDDISDMTLGLELPLNSTDHDSILQFRQRYALTVFFYSTKGDKWSNECNFINVTAHVCDWTCPPTVAGSLNILDRMGVACHDDEGYIIAMELPNNNLSGTLPEELQGLDFMSSIVLPSNNIQGTIPFMAFNNTFLHREYGIVVMGFMILLGNQLSGSIPDGINALTDLKGLWLQNNLLTGSVPSSLASDTLQLIDLNNNLLSGAIPKNLFQIELLILMNFAGNLLSGTIPDDIRLPSLGLLSLSENFVEGSLPDAIGSMESISFLDLSYNSLTGTILPSSLSQLTALTSLALCGNQLTGEALNWSVIGEMKLLRLLCLGENDVTGTIPTEIGTFEFLEFFDVGNHDEDRDETRTTFLKGWLPTELGQLQSLTALIINNNNIGGTVPTEFGDLSLLRHLLLDNNPLWGHLPTELNSLQNLGTLRLEQTNLIGDLSVLCNRLPETDAVWRRGFSGDCLEEAEISCCCCLVCCNNDGFCDDNDGSGCS